MTLSRAIFENEDFFQECLNAWSNSIGNNTTPIWKDISEKYGLPDSERLRDLFRKERVARGILKTNHRTVQQNPRVAIIDLETLPLKIEGYLWGIRDQYLSYDMVAQDSHMLSWSAKYLNSSQVFHDIMTPEEAIKYDSLRVTNSLMEFINNCDIVIGHNWNGFDGKILNSELMFHYLPPVKYRSIDTYTLLKNNFRETSYKLADINKKYGIRDKISNEGMRLWVKCANGEQEALDTMLDYNDGDIFSTEELFWRIQPYVNNSVPNFGTYQDGLSKACNCGCTEFKADGEWYTQQAKFERFRCSNCGAVHRGKRNLLSKEESKALKIRL